MIDEKNI